MLGRVKSKLSQSLVYHQHTTIHKVCGEADEMSLFHGLRQVVNFA